MGGLASDPRPRPSPILTVPEIPLHFPRSRDSIFPLSLEQRLHSINEKSAPQLIQLSKMPYCTSTNALNLLSPYLLHPQADDLPLRSNFGCSYIIISFKHFADGYKYPFLFVPSFKIEHSAFYSSRNKEKIK